MNWSTIQELWGLFLPKFIIASLISLSATSWGFVLFAEGNVKKTVNFCTFSNLSEFNHTASGFRSRRSYSSSHACKRELSVHFCDNLLVSYIGTCILVRVNCRLLSDQQTISWIVRTTAAHFDKCWAPSLFARVNHVFAGLKESISQLSW